MTKENTIRLFESKRVRVLWDDRAEKWYFSVIDIIEILSASKNPRRYWSDLKIKLGNSVISPLNAKDLGRKDNEQIEGN